MRWFLDLQTRNKLFLGFGVMVILLAIIAVTAYKGIKEIGKAQEALVADFHHVADLKDIRFHQARIRSDALTMLVVSDRSALEALRKDGDEYTRKNDALMRRSIAHGKSSSQHQAKLEEFDSLRKAFAETREKQVMPLIFAGKLPEARELIAGVQAERNQKMSSIIDEIISEEEENIRQTIASSIQLGEQSLSIFILAGGLAVLLGALSVLFLERAIAAPLRGVAVLAEQIASGDLTGNISGLQRRDEVGALTEAFRRMLQSLREVNREIRDGVNVLATSASEILAATTQVAAGAAQTATAVSETTTTVEEVKQTAHLSAQKAKMVSDGDRKTNQVVQVGRQAVEEAIEGMKRIREQMDSIGGNIIRLGEQGQAIGEITAVVTDVAEQANLLAVNAAIEAAKAGEQGKGFLVVAQEVKSLAGQAKQATAQVRAILNDVQKSIGAAVMATEQGGKTVGAGVERSAKAGEAIRLLADNIAEAAQASVQIAASSQQQLVGMDQVAGAMESIKQASTQNVAASKQAEEAARDLQGVGRDLKRLAERYKV